MKKNNVINIHDNIESAVAAAMEKESPEAVLLEELENLEDFPQGGFDGHTGFGRKWKSKLAVCVTAFLLFVIVRKIFGASKK